MAPASRVKPALQGSAAHSAPAPSPLKLRPEITPDLTLEWWEPFEDAWNALRSKQPRPPDRLCAIFAASRAGWFLEPLGGELPDEAAIAAMPARMLVPASKAIFVVVNAVLLSDPN